MINLSIFLLFCLVIIFPAGYLLIRSSQIKVDKFTNLTLSFVVGMVSFTYLSFLIRLVNLPYEFTIAFLYLIVLIYFCFKLLGIYSFSHISFHNAFRHNKPCQYKKDSNRTKFIYILISFSIILISITSLIWIHLTSRLEKGELKISAAGDSLWHIAITEELINHFPPQNPGFPPIALKNYHYLYDFLIASTYRITKIPVFNLYFHYFSVLSATIFVLATYIILSLFTKRRRFRLIGLIITIFTGNMSYLLPLFSKNYDFFSRSNIFMSNQPFDQGFNPFNLLAYGLFLIAIYLFYFWDKSRNLKLLLILSLIIGTITGFKIYGGIVLFGSLTLIFFYSLIFQRKAMLELISPFIIFVPIFFLNRGESATSIIFAPFWLLTKLITDSDRINLTSMVLRQQYYQNTGNVIRLIQLRIEQLLIYLVGNLNIRIFSFAWIIPKIISFFTIRIADLFILISAFSALTIPLLFIQTRVPYDITQFTPYGLILLSILSMSPIEYIVTKLSKGGYKIIALSFLTVIFLLTVPTNFDLIYSRINSSKETIPKDEIEALNFLRNISSTNAVIFSDLSGNKRSLMYLPALSGRRTFLAGQDTISLTGVNVMKRKAMVESYLSNSQCKDWSKIIKEFNISYLYLSGDGLVYSTNLKNSIYPIIFKNDSVLIYQTVNI